MKLQFALVNGNKAVPVKGTLGICPCCGYVLIAKCGNIKVHHWAHKSKRNCDPWWENQTEWHRSWKNNFHIEWQEVPMKDEHTAEIHIADIRTTHGLIIEFQHSYINAQERSSRELFYQNMVWVVDGARSKNDYKRLVNGISNWRRTNTNGVYSVPIPKQCFPATWLDSPVPVTFDFKDAEPIEYPRDMRNYLYCLTPKNNEGDVFVMVVTREAFIQSAIDGVLRKLPEELEKQIDNPNQNISRIKDSTHYYDARRGRLVKKWRF